MSVCALGGSGTRIRLRGTPKIAPVPSRAFRLTTIIVSVRMPLRS